MPALARLAPIGTSDVALCSRLARRAIAGLVSYSPAERRALLELYTEQGLRLRIADCDVATVAIVDDRTVAFALLRGCHLTGLYVDPDMQRRGLGGRLLTALEANAAERGCKALVTYAAPDSVGFYQRLGFSHADGPPRGIDGPGFRVWEMTRRTLTAQPPIGIENR